MRIPVAHVVNLIANGMTVEEILADYPDLEAEDIREAWGARGDREIKSQRNVSRLGITRGTRGIKCYWDTRRGLPTETRHDP